MCIWFIVLHQSVLSRFVEKLTNAYFLLNRLLWSIVIDVITEVNYWYITEEHEFYGCNNKVIMEVITEVVYWCNNWTSLITEVVYGCNNWHSLLM